MIDMTTAIGCVVVPKLYSLVMQMFWKIDELEKWLFDNWPVQTWLGMLCLLYYAKKYLDWVYQRQLQVENEEQRRLRLEFEQEMVDLRAFWVEIGRQARRELGQAHRALLRQLFGRGFVSEEERERKYAEKLDQRIKKYSGTLSAADVVAVDADSDETKWRLPAGGQVLGSGPTSERAGTCSICFEDYQEGHEIAWSANNGCDHVFHTECVRSWLLTLTARYDELCPTCRQPFTTKA